MGAINFKLGLVTGVLLFGLAGISLGVQAELKVEHQAPISIGSKVTLTSEVLSTNIALDVMLPTNFEVSSSAHTYPVMFILGQHGPQFFHAVSGVVKHLADVERMPETIVVALDGGSPSPDIYHNNMWRAQATEKWDSWADPELYRDFFRKELFPFLQQHYRANDKSAVIGISGSSFFPLYDLLQPTNLFDDYIFLAAADVIGMGYNKDRTFVDELATRFGKDLKNTPSVFFSVASNDVDKDQRYQRNFDQLVSRMKGHKAIQFKTKIQPNEGHYDALLKTVMDFIEFKYPKSLWSARYIDIIAQPGNALANLDQYYQSLTEMYGIELLPRANRWNSVNRLGFVSRTLIRDKRFDEAVEVSKRYVEYQPRSWLAYESLGKALEAKGDIGAAIKAITTAIALDDDKSNHLALNKYLTLLEEKNK